MNKKLLKWFSIGFMGLTFIFALVATCISQSINGGAILAMTLLAMLFALAALVCLLLYFFYKPKQASATATPKADVQ